MAVPDACLEEVMNLYRSHLDSEGLHYVIFGHIGDNHVHVNILPETPEEYTRGKELYRTFAEHVVRMNGSTSAEHGIGKLKKDFLKLMFGTGAVKQMHALKEAFDPEYRLGPGTLLDVPATA